MGEFLPKELIKAEFTKFSNFKLIKVAVTSMIKIYSFVNR